MSKKSQEVLIDKQAKSMYNIKCYNKLKVGIIFKFILALAIFMKNNYFQNFLELNLIQRFFGVCQKFKRIIV